MRNATLLTALALVLTALVYAPTLGYPFITLDDGPYVTENPHVLAGLRAEGIAWAFQNVHASNWHPLTWMSHMLDVSLFGTNPGAHHAVNVGLHLLNTWLLAGLLAALGVSRTASLWVAAVFGLHPLHVESVAWISERKDVLSTLFAFLALRAYAAYSARPAAGRWLLVTVLFALSLLAKSMYVTLPALFLVLDARAARPAFGRSLLEKLPWFAMSVAVASITFFAQDAARSDLSQVSIGGRMATAVVGYARYAGKFVWPLESSLIYPHPYLAGGERYSAGIIALSSALLVVVSAACLWRRRERWYLAGWAWFLGLLVPVIGLVQVGSQAIADRYTYVPYVGLSLMVAIWVERTVRERPALARTFAVLAFGTVGACAWLARKNVTLWSDPERLFEHAVELYPSNPLAMLKLAVLHDHAGQSELAERELQRVIELAPTMPEAHYGLAAALSRAGKPVRATRALEATLKLNPDYFEALVDLGLLRAMAGQAEAGERLVRRAIEINPLHPAVWRNLGLILQSRGESESARAYLEKSLEMGEDVLTLRALGMLHLRAGRSDAAAPLLERALELSPEDASLRQMLDAAR